MPPRLSNFRLWISIALAGLAYGHATGFNPGMFCIYDSSGAIPNYNENRPVHPLFQLSYSEYWMHNYEGCGKQPPPPGAFLDIPSGGSFEVDLSDNLANTRLNPNAHLTDWGDGLEHPDDYNNPQCIIQPNLHTQNESMAAGTSFAISYNPDPDTASPEDFTVFTVEPNTPFKRVAQYKVPSGMPLCPSEGCLCMFGWIPHHCGEPNIYLFPSRCRVISDGTTPRTIGKPQPPVYCEDDPSKCVRGPKQVLIWNQAERNNIVVNGTDWDGLPKSPAYNEKCGFSPGAQTDIFEDGNTFTTGNGSTTALSSSTATPSLARSSTATSHATDHALPASASHTSNRPSVTDTPSSPALSLSTGTAKHSLRASASTAAGISTAPTSIHASDSWCALPTGTPTSPASAPTSTLHSSVRASGSGTPTSKTSQLPTQDSPGAHSRRMVTRRGKHNVI